MGDRQFYHNDLCFIDKNQLVRYRDKIQLPTYYLTCVNTAADTHCFAKIKALLTFWAVPALYFRRFEVNFYT